MEWENGLTASERGWIELIDRKMEQGGCVLLLGPQPVELHDLLRRTAWERAFRDPLRMDHYFYAASPVSIGADPATVLGELFHIGGPIHRTQDLGQGQEGTRRAVLIRLDGATEDSPATVHQALRDWIQLAMGFGGPHNGPSLLRLCLVVDQPNLLSALTISVVPGQLKTVRWDGPFDDELLTLSRSLLAARGLTQGLSNVEAAYLVLRTLDLAGGARRDLEAAAALVASRRQLGGDWLERIDWTSDDPWIQDRCTAWIPLLATHLHLIRDLVAAGGHMATPPPQLLPFIETLWGAGLWVRPRGATGGWLTPAAITALKAHSHLVGPTHHLVPSIDRVTSDLIHRSLTFERSLKHRFLREVNAYHLEKSILTELSTIKFGKESLAAKVERRTGTKPTSAEVVWDLTLGEFLTLRTKVTGIFDARLSTLKDVRNDVMHGRRANLSMFRNLSSAEEIIFESEADIEDGHTLIGHTP